MPQYGADGSEIGNLGLRHDLNLVLAESVSGSATEADVFVPSGVVDAQSVGMCLPIGDDGVNFPNAVEQVALSVVLDSHILSFLAIYKNNTCFSDCGMCGASGAAPNGSSEEDTVPSELLFQFVVVKLRQLIRQYPFHATDVMSFVKDIAAFNITISGYSVQTGVEEVPEFKFFSVHILCLIVMH